jgi:GNAT superfamily N-acetyltransferase
MTAPVSLTFRYAVADDAATLSAFARAQFVTTFAAQNNPDDLAIYLDSAFSVALQRAEIEDASRRYLLLEVDGGLAGYALLNDRAAHALVTAQHPVELQRFYVDQAWHGHGIAARLMARVVDEARTLGGDVLWLGVWESNLRAIRFYEKQGYAVVGEQIFVVGTDPQRDKVMARRV